MPKAPTIESRISQLKLESLVIATANSELSGDYTAVMSEAEYLKGFGDIIDSNG